MDRLMTEPSAPVADEVDHDPAEPLGDLTPRSARPVRRRRWVPTLLLLAIVGALAFVLINGLGNAALFFRNVDEAVEKRDELGDRRFRLQGTPMDGTIVETRIDGESVVSFTVIYEGVQADVVHRGEPPGLFQAEVPVVLEGRWTSADPADPDFVEGANDGWFFASDRMLVKHTEVYRDDRVKQAESGGQVGRDEEPDPVTP